MGEYGACSLVIFLEGKAGSYNQQLLSIYSEHIDAERNKAPSFIIGPGGGLWGRDMVSKWRKSVAAVIELYLEPRGHAVGVRRPGVREGFLRLMSMLSPGAPGSKLSNPKGLESF